MAYLNQAGTSWPKPEPVRAAMTAAFELRPEAWAASLEAQRQELACNFGILDPERLLITTGCTSALAAAVADLPWEAGDRMLLSGMEHHALVRPARALESRGVELSILPRASADEDGRGGPLSLAALEKELRKGRVRLVALSAASNVTGELFPLEAVLTRAHEHGALVLVDAAQVAGWMAFDLKAMGVDLFAFAGHKGPHGPSGIGGLYVAPHVAMNAPAVTCSIQANAGDPSCGGMPGYCDVGSVNQVALAGLVAGLRWVSEPARAERLILSRALVARLAAELGELPGVTFHGAADPEARMPTLALTLEGLSGAELGARLLSHGVVASGGFQCAPLTHETLGTSATGVLRLSAGPSNDENDVEQALGALRQIAQSKTSIRGRKSERARREADPG